MRYETRNNYGFISLFLGTILIVISLLFTSGVTMVLILLLAIALIGVGGYMMTRSFTDVDQDHPDYADYQRRRKEHEQ